PTPVGEQLEPGDGVHVQLAPCSAPGSVSTTCAPSASEGPPLETVIVYVTGVPGTAESWPSVFVISRSTRGVSVSVSVAESSPWLVSVSPAPGDSLAVFESGARAAGSIVPDNRKVT